MDIFLYLGNASRMFLHISRGYLLKGAVITIDGERKGAYKDKQGNIHVVNTTCTHIGCEVEWNSGERTWDCPCHGSRFSYSGDVVEGPTEKPLKKYDYKMIDNFKSKDSGY